MSVTNGQTANQTTFNNAFLSRTADTSTIGKITLNNTADVLSGPMITNIQRYVNELAAVVGVVGEGDSSALIYTSNNYLVNGESHKQSISRLDTAFDTSTGHDHDGANSKAIDAANLDNLNYFRADWFGIQVSGVSGTSFDISSDMSGKVPGGGDTAAGVATTSPHNRCEIRNATTETYIEDGEGQRVYGRITESAGVWTISFYTNEAGVETAHNLSLQDLAIAFKEVFTLGTLPTFSAESGILGSFDLTADLAYATTTLAGKILLSSTAPADLGPAASIGSLTTAARADHVHKIPQPEVEYRTITGPEAAAKQLTLSVTPGAASKVLVDALGGTAQEYGVDYTVAGSILSWSGLGLDLIGLSAGDKLRIVYWP